MGLCILTKYGAMEHNNFLAGSKTDKDAKREKMKINALGVRSTHTGIAQGKALGIENATKIEP